MKDDGPLPGPVTKIAINIEHRPEFEKQGIPWPVYYLQGAVYLGDKQVGIIWPTNYVKALREKLLSGPYASYIGVYPISDVLDLGSIHVPMPKALAARHTQSGMKCLVMPVGTLLAGSGVLITNLGLLERANDEPLIVWPPFEGSAECQLLPTEQLKEFARLVISVAEACANLTQIFDSGKSDGPEYAMLDGLKEMADDVRHFFVRSPFWQRFATRHFYAPLNRAFDIRVLPDESAS